MATGNDWETRKARVTEQIEIQIPALISNYEMKTRAVGDLIKQMQTLEDEKGKLEHEMNKAEQDAGTADREFIERRQTFPDPFKPSKIYTVQDFTFYLFFVSYLVFLVAVSMVMQEKIKTFVGGIVVLFFIVALMYRYI
jgi:predicted RND superfamily exporter protein